MAFSVDGNASKYYMQASPSNDSIVISELGGMIKQALRTYNKYQKDMIAQHNRKLPVKPHVLMVYRTGVSDAEKGRVSGVECKAIMDACAAMPLQDHDDPLIRDRHGKYR